MSSFGNDSIRTDKDEFPYWQWAMAVRIITVGFIILPLTIFVHGSILVSFFTSKKLRKPTNMVHVTLTVHIALNKAAGSIGSIFFFQNAVRFCICDEVITNLYIPATAYNVIFAHVMLTGLSIMQLLTIKGKKRLITWKTVGVLVTFTTLYSLLWTIATALTYNLRENISPCTKLCQGEPQDVNLSVGAHITFSAVLIVILPCLLIIFITQLMSCCIFKQQYIGDDSQLNRRIISLPFFMPLVTLAASILYITLREVVPAIIRATVTNYYPNWIQFSNEILSYVLDGGSGFIYPLVLLYIHPHLRSTWYKTVKYIPAVVSGSYNRIHSNS